MFFALLILQIRTTIKADISKHNYENDDGGKCFVRNALLHLGSSVQWISRINSLPLSCLPHLNLFYTVSQIYWNVKLFHLCCCSNSKMLANSISLPFYKLQPWNYFQGSVCQCCQWNMFWSVCVHLKIWNIMCKKLSNIPEYPTWIWVGWGIQKIKYFNANSNDNWSHGRDNIKDIH